MFPRGGYYLLDVDPDRILGQEFDEFHELAVFLVEMIGGDPDSVTPGDLALTMRNCIFYPNPTQNGSSNILIHQYLLILLRIMNFFSSLASLFLLFLLGLKTFLWTRGTGLRLPHSLSALFVFFEFKTEVRES